MKNTIVLFIVCSISYSAQAGYYIKNWGIRPIKSELDCYWLWAELWDDNNTSKKSDDSFIGNAETMVCDYNLKLLKNGVDSTGNLFTVRDMSAILKNKKKFSNKINLYKRGEILQISGYLEPIFPIKATAINLSNNQKYEFVIDSNKFIVPNALDIGIYNIEFKNRDGEFMFETTIRIE